MYSFFARSINLFRILVFVTSRITAEAPTAVPTKNVLHRFLDSAIDFASYFAHQPAKNPVIAAQVPARTRIKDAWRWFRVPSLPVGHGAQLPRALDKIVQSDREQSMKIQN